MVGKSPISNLIKLFMSLDGDVGSETRFQIRALVFSSVAISITGLIILMTAALSGVVLEGLTLVAAVLLIALGSVPFVFKFTGNQRFASILFVVLLSILAATISFADGWSAAPVITILYVAPVFAAYLLELRDSVASLLFAVVISAMVLAPAPTTSGAGELLISGSQILVLLILDVSAICFVSLSRGIHSRAQETEEHSRLHQARLAHMTRLSTVGEMASGIAHELNQPLTAITGYVDGSAHRLRATGQTPPEILSALKKASDQAMRAGEVIRRIRHFVSQSDEQREPIDVNQAVGEIIEMLEFEANRNNISIKTALASSLPNVEASVIQIQQVILNLARNGLEAMSLAEIDAGAVEISTYASEDSQIRVKVRDTGPGLSNSSRSHLFEPFYTTKQGGLGMGLSICQSIVEQHGGEIWAEMGTSESHGAAFCFTLPAMKGEQHVDA